MIILVHVETHIFAEEQLIDWVFSDTTGCGLLSPEDFGTLWNHQDSWIQLAYDDTSTVGAVQKDIINEVIRDIYDDDDQRFFDEYQRRFYFLNNKSRYSIADPNASFTRLLERYLDPEGTGTVYVEFLASMNAGQICREDNLRYYMNSHEGNRHNEPHVHVDDLKTHDSASISILNLIVLDGYLSNRSKRKAIQKIAQEQRAFIEFWNTKTDGLYVDINKYFNLIDY